MAERRFHIGDIVRYRDGRDEFWVVGYTRSGMVVGESPRYTVFQHLPERNCALVTTDLDTLVSEIVETCRVGEDDLHAAVKQALVDAGVNV